MKKKENIFITQRKKEAKSEEYTKIEVNLRQVGLIEIQLSQPSRGHRRCKAYQPIKQEPQAKKHG